MGGHDRPIHVIGADLIDPMPVKPGCLVTQPIGQVDYDLITFCGDDIRTRPLAIYTNDRPSVAIRGSPDPSCLPVVFHDRGIGECK